MVPTPQGGAVYANAGAQITVNGTVAAQANIATVSRMMRLSNPKKHGTGPLQHRRRVPVPAQIERDTDLSKKGMGVIDLRDKERVLPFHANRGRKNMCSRTQP